jgi:uncharacterized LabA/DUF88 family protein
MSADHVKIALLIDAENSPSSKIGDVLSEVSKYGVTSVKRAYGNWKSPNLSGWEKKLHEHAIRPIQQFAYTKGKNATDMAIVIDAMDLMYSQKLDAFCVVSSDSDFTPLVMRILNNGLTVYGFGDKHTPEPFVNACSKFLFLEQIGTAVETTPQDEPALVAKPMQKGRNELRGDTRLVNLLRGAATTCADEDGWSNLEDVARLVDNQASFDVRNYGYPAFGKLIAAIEIFEIDVRGTQTFIRDNGVRSGAGKMAPSKTTSAATAKAAGANEGAA